MTPHPLAAIPVIDWHGPQFLAFYGFALIVSLIWSLRRRHQLVSQFIRPGVQVQIDDPYEAAYLAGGGPRTLTTVIVHLLANGSLLEKKPGWLKAVALFPGESIPASNPMEGALVDAVWANRSKGVSLQKARELLTSQFGRIERSLAAKGLRPTTEEYSGTGFPAILPLLFLLGLGVVKFCIGVWRDKPTSFLVIALFITLVLIIFVAASNRNRLTPAGREELTRLRGLHSAAVTVSPSVSTLPMAVALGGLAALAGYEPVLAMNSHIMQELKFLQSSTGFDTSVSGCGSSGSGCGSGGCGGCGGGD